MFNPDVYDFSSYPKRTWFGKFIDWFRNIRKKKGK